MSDTIEVGIIGCGNISRAYCNAAKSFRNIRITSVADRDGAAAEKLAAEYGFRMLSVEALLADPAIGIVLNLTNPQAHAELNTRILEAGKHAYTEKPFALDRESGEKVLALAKARGLLTGGAPDTFLGGAHQTCRKLIDDGSIGKVVAGTAFMMCHGHESWHPNPGFYYLSGGGPLFDMGPYYITALVNMLGPVKQVAAMGSRAYDERVATTPSIAGTRLPVEVNTHIAGLLEFASGAVVTLVTSFDVYRHTNHNIELHGTAGSLRVPDPNCFGGEVKLFQPWMTDWAGVALTHGFTDNMRSIGAADLARSLSGGAKARCSGELACHVLDVMCSLEESAATGCRIAVRNQCERPAALSAGEL